MNTFGSLFKRYRLRAEFFSLSDFASALAEKGYVYDLSIFSMWQQGRRIPSRRSILVAVIALFVECGCITSLEQANEFLESAGHGYLTKNEQETILNQSSSQAKNTFLFD